jgi:hypothetical protein
MALNLTRTYTYTTGATISSSENNTNENTIYSAFQGLEGATSSMSKLPLDANPTSALHAATKQYVDIYASLGLPNLEWVSVTTVRVKANTGTANQTKILFPDGELRTVTEDTGSANKYRLFDITATANFTSGTEDSGLRTSLSETVNNWYVIYAVKSQINSANFVLVGDQTFPTVGNFSTLNTRYGTSSWRPLGYIRNGDGAGATGDIVNFVQEGNLTLFVNLITSANLNAAPLGGTVGVKMATTASATSLTWSPAAGSGATNIPDTVRAGWVRGFGHSYTGSLRLTDDAQNRSYAILPNISNSYQQAFAGLSAGFKIDGTGGTAAAWDIVLYGFIDNALGIGSNPIL